MSIIATVPVGADPWGVALTGDDRTLYVGNGSSNTVSIVDTESLTADDSIPVGSGPYFPVLGPNDDTLYAMNYSSGSISVVNTSARTESSRITGFQFPWVAEFVGPKLIVAGFRGRTYIVDPITRTIDDSATTANAIQAIATSSSSGLLYQVDPWDTPRKLIGVNTAAPLSVVSTASIVGTPRSVAIAADGATAFVTIQAMDVLNGPSGVGRVNLTTNTLDDTLAFTPANFSASGVAISPDGSKLFSAHPDEGGGPSILYRIDIATWSVDDSVLLGVGAYGNVVLSSTGDRAYIANSASNTVSVVDTGLVSPTPEPTPPPAVSPPGSPIEIVASPGDASALVSWAPPTMAGSYPVSNYQVQSSPEGRSCLAVAPSTHCTVSGLTNGRAYTFSVRALNGAGWGAWSDPSAAVTPAAPVRPSIVISGSRDFVNGRPGITVTGTASGLGLGAELHPWWRKVGEGAGFVPGRVRLLDASGDFQWWRRASGSTEWRVYVESAGTRSNVVTIRRSR